MIEDMFRAYIATHVDCVLIMSLANALWKHGRETENKAMMTMSTEILEAHNKYHESFRKTCSSYYPPGERNPGEHKPEEDIRGWPR